MNFILLQSPSATSAAFEIILMLTGAAFIGIITTYFYCKAKFGKEINLLNTALSESAKSKGEIENQLASLKEEMKEKNDRLEALEISFTEIDQKNEKLKKEYEASQSLYLKAMDEIEESNKKLHEKENELKEKDAVLKRIAERKHLLDYSSFGSAKKEGKDDLKMISGIGSFIEEKLNMLDIYTIDQISKFSKKDIEAVNAAIEFFPGRIERDEWVAQAIALIKNGGKNSQILENIRKRKNKINYERIGISKKEEADDLTIVSGIGAWIQEKLNALDIYTFQQIANFTREDEKSVTEAIEFFPGRIERDEWVVQTKELVYSGGKETALFERMKMKKHKIDYSTIGIAHKEDAQDLTKINGIGSYIQDKLHFLEIYTFEQISRFTKHDIETVTDIIEFFPGRIERDNWVKQAKNKVKGVTEIA